MSENLLTAQFKGEPYEKQFTPKIFSGYFQNIRELQRFLNFAKYFQTKNVVMGLGLALKTLRILKGGSYAKVS